MRMAKGMKQNAVAERLGITNAYLSKIEKCSVPCPSIISKKLSDLYTGKLNEVITG
ncbi:MAG: helix-turn-helix transcriptional regulator [Negativicutes bacterium]|nr:helix-turn-helix transcriptional regulator [Negativicutes bacterium]